MRALPIDAYGQGLVQASEGSDEGWLVRYADGITIPLALGQWLGDLKPGDGSLVDRSDGATLDVGCGPGRLAAAVAERGYKVLGVDIAPVAVQMTRRRGVTVLRRSIFQTLPGEGHWDRILLADGNIGIGGDPTRLLARCADLLAPQGVIVLETDRQGPGCATCRCASSPPVASPRRGFPGPPGRRRRGLRRRPGRAEGRRAVGRALPLVRRARLPNSRKAA